MTREERLNFLKEVKRKEIIERIKIAKEQGGMENNEEYSVAREEQSIIECEIAELESITDKEYVNYLKEKQKQELLEKLKQDDFLKFIDNDEFLFANKNKKFTLKEKVAIIVHSTNQSLEEKVKALTNLLENSKDNKFNNTIKLWIDYKQKVLEHVKSIDNCQEVFVVCNKVENLYDNILPLVFKRLDDCLKYWSARRIDIVKVIDKPENKSPRNMITLTDKYQISDISYAGIEHEYKNLPKEEKLEYIKVQLKNPFKPFTIISCSVYNGIAIVADINNKKTKEQVEQAKSCRKLDGWLECEIPIYMFPNGWMHGEEYLQARCLFGEYDNLSEIKEVVPTLEQKEYIKYLKKAIKKKV